MSGMKMVVIGVIAALIGGGWIIDGVSDGRMNQVLGGLWWKGSLLTVAGIVLMVMGFRRLKDIVDPPNKTPYHAITGKPIDDQSKEPPPTQGPPNQ